MARPALRKVGRPEEGAPRLAHLDRDRRLVEAAQADPARFEALYRKYLAQVYSFAYYELRDHHEAEDATERTFLAALANLGRFEERARPADGEGASTFRVWLFQIARNAVAERRRGLRRRPEAPLEAAGFVAAAVDIASVETSIKYAGYLRRQESEIERACRDERRRIPAGFPFERVAGLSKEVVQRLSQVRPDTLGQALRIPGVTPAAVAVLGAHVGRVPLTTDDGSIVS